MRDLSEFTDNHLGSYFALPFTVVDAKGKVWTCASNLKYLVALKSKSKHKRWRGDGENLGKFLQLLSASPQDARQVEVEELLAWTGPKPKPYGSILGVTVPLPQLVQLVETCPTQTFEVWKPGADLCGDDRALALQAEDRWRVIQMGCDLSKVENSDDIPSFELPEPEPEEESLFDLAMSLGED